MRELRHLRLIAVTGLVIASFAAVGCEDPKPTTTTSSGSSSSSSSSSGNGGGGGSGGGGSGGGGSGGGGSGGGSATPQLDAAVTGVIPIDATPDITADNVYLVGIDVDGNPVISQGKMDGSAAPKALWTGTPLEAPVNIATSTDGMTLYVTDPGAEDPTGKLGRIFSIPAAGGAIAIVTNADGYRPRGLEIITEDGKDTIYFAGSDPAGEGGIFKVPADNSAAVTEVAKGEDLKDPSGIAVSANGDVYACSNVHDSDGLGTIVSVKGGAVTTVAMGVYAGYPCGVALSADDTTLLVSILEPTKKTDAVLIVDLATNNTSYFTMGIDTFLESAGLHRAKKGGNTFAWADSHANGGTVFRVMLP